MPKIIEDAPKVKKPLADQPPPSDLLKRYVTHPYTAEMQLAYYEVSQIRNLQNCSCGHDRCCHSNHLGTGRRQVLVTDCPSAGRCGVKGCDCGSFTFSKSGSSPEGRKNREREKKLTKVFPPEEK